METWYVLFDGDSEDGRGNAYFVKRTTNKEEAKRHYEKCKNDFYSTGYVQYITDKESGHIDAQTKLEYL